MARAAPARGCLRAEYEQMHLRPLAAPCVRQLAAGMRGRAQIAQVAHRTTAEHDPRADALVISGARSLATSSAPAGESAPAFAGFGLTRHAKDSNAK